MLVKRTKLLLHGLSNFQKCNKFDMNSFKLCNDNGGIRDYLTVKRLPHSLWTHDACSEALAVRIMRVHCSFIYLSCDMGDNES